MDLRPSVLAVAAALATGALGFGAAPASAEFLGPCGGLLQPKCPPPPPTPTPTPTPTPPPPAPDPRGVDPASPNPLEGHTWWVDRTWGSLWRQYREFKREGRSRDAAMVRRLAVYPSFKWFGTWDHHPRSDIRKYLDRVQEEQPGSVAQLTIMRRIHNRCSSTYDGGGPSANASYMRWIRGFAQGIGHSRVVIAYEPDSLGTLNCMSRSAQRTRLRLHRAAVDVLSQLPNATIYLEAGASDWLPARIIAPRLRFIGVSKVRGFMVNVTHYDWTWRNARYCRDISRRVGGKHCVISTTQNGAGPLHHKRWRDRSRNLWYIENVWCNPPNAAAGPPPQVDPRGQGNVVDAYLWIGRPGYSAGSCNGGPKRGAGVFWPKLALDLASRARW